MQVFSRSVLFQTCLNVSATRAKTEARATNTLTTTGVNVHWEQQDQTVTVLCSTLCYMSRKVKI